MNIKQLETFIWIVRMGSFAAAAERLYTTQSSVSARIQELEQTIGVSLFDRTHHRARLTPKGRELIPYAERVIALSSEICHVVGNPKSLTGAAKLGVAELIAITWLPKLVKTIREKYSSVTLDVTMDLTNALIEKLRDGALDLALVPGPVIEPNLASESLGYVAFSWMAGRNIKTPARILSPEDLQKLPIISLSEESHHYRTIEHWFTSNNAYFSAAVRCNNMSVAGYLVMDSQGIGHLPAFPYAEQLKEGKLRILKTHPKTRAVEFFAVFPRGRFQPLTHAIAVQAREVSEFLRQ